MMRTGKFESGSSEGAWLRGLRQALWCCHSEPALRERNPYCAQDVSCAADGSWKLKGIPRRALLGMTRGALCSQSPTPCFSVGLCRLTALVTLCSLLALTVQAQQPPAPQETTVGNYSIHESAEIGYRFINERGNGSMFDTTVDQHTGLRLLDQSLEIRSLDHSGLVFDSLSLSGFGFGGDPNNVLRLRAYKNKLYNFNANFRRDHSFWDYDLFANPLNSPATLMLYPVRNSPHRFDIVRRMSDYNLTLLPQSPLRFRLGYSRNVSQGPSFSSLRVDDAGGVETLLFQPWRQTQNAYQLGADWLVLPRTNISFDEFFTSNKGDNSQIDRNFNFQLANGTPVDLGLPTPAGCTLVSVRSSPPTAPPTCSSFLDYSRFAPMRANALTEQLGFQSNYFKKLEMSGRVMYSNSRGKSPSINELFNGFINGANFRQFNFTGAARSHRITTGADYAATWSLNDRFRITDAFRFHDFRVPGTQDSVQDAFYAASLVIAPNTFNPATCPPPFNSARCPQHTNGSPADVINHNAFTFLGQEYKTNLLEGEYDFAKWFKARLGYRYRNRLVTQRNLSVDNMLFFPSAPNRGACAGHPLQANGTCVANVNTLTTQGTEINEHSAVFGFSSRLLKDDALRLNGDLELLWADNFFIRLDPRRSERYRARASYEPASWISLSFATNIVERRNRTVGIGFLGRDRNFSVDALLSHNQAFGLDLGYDYSTTDSRANICFTSNLIPQTAPRCPTDRALFPGLSFYDSWTHFGRVSLLWKPLPVLTAHIGTELTSTDGKALFLNPLAPTGPLRNVYLEPVADLDWQFAKGLDWTARWGYYDYHEDGLSGPTLPRNFHAHIGTVGLRYSF